MKKRNLIISLMLSLALCAVSVSTVFAVNYPVAYPGTDGATTKLESVNRNVDGSQEMQVEAVAVGLANETVAGGYKLITTEALMKALGGDVVIIDTMPQGAYNRIHIKGAFCVEAPMVDPSNPKKIHPTAPQYNASENPSDYTKAFDKFMKKYATKKFYNSKTKKWVTKQPKKAEFKGSKTKYVLKEKYKKTKFVTYCGYVGCGRSHLGAQYLVKMGLKNVYRYSGGISAWYDAAGEMEGTYIAQ